MSRKISLVLLAALAVAFGLAFVIAPTKFGELIGLDLGRAGAIAAQLMGAATLAWGLILFAARRFDEEARRAILFATGLGDAVAAAVAAVAALSGLMNLLGFGVATICLLGAMGCMAALAHRPEESRSAPDELELQLHNYE
ncbi:peptidoglycan/LPS O-acetylase OafA/YrhL [Rhodoblastus acidophilus]|uniref:hypothetical protein n=1 Tax=Rhodoblastus acidophilus TaxID=1074 RepID=UPI00222432F9|nr:hypothetical protein [Rhodoblastus acidophilus]MCW2316313.1 peptidoglycan/LPS O-acetylase OafA/YrhL [Rhodoblastus acidophilus]